MARLSDIDPTVLRKGDIVLYSSASFISKAITWFTGGRWSHSAVYAGDGTVIEAAEVGVKVTPLHDTLVSHRAVQVMRLKGGLSDEDADAIVDKARSLIGRPYDIPQLISLGGFFLLKKLGIRDKAIVHDDDGELICSEVVAVAYQSRGIGFGEVKLVTPESLSREEALEVVYRQL